MGVAVKRTIPVIVVLLMPLAAHADPLAPVNEVMNVTRQLWSEDRAARAGLFRSGIRLSRLYSAEFTPRTRQRSKNPAFGLEEGESEGNPFDYDVIANSQDGCPLEDIKAEKTAEAAGVVTVTVTFKLWRCVEDAAERDHSAKCAFC